MKTLENMLVMCDTSTDMSDDEDVWMNILNVGMEGLKVRPMLVKESDDPCVYDTATGEFVFVNKGDETWK